MTVEVAKLSAEFGLAKWLLGLTLVATLSAIGGGIWWAATLTAEVKHLATEIARPRARCAGIHQKTEINNGPNIHSILAEHHPVRFHQTVLDNGLQVIAELNDQARSVASGFFVKAGSRDETPDLAGVSHFLEHMIFKGTPNRDALAVNRDFDRVGAKHNAQTSEEDTFYHVTCLPEYLPSRSTSSRISSGPAFARTTSRPRKR